MNVYTVSEQTGEWPPRVAAIILAEDKYAAIDKAEELAEMEEWPETTYEVAEAHEHSSLEDVYRP